MSKLAKTLILVAIFAILPLSAEEPSSQAAGGSPMPDLLWFETGLPQEYPVFVSAKNALLPDGELNLELLGDGSQLLLQDILDGDFTNCHGGWKHLGGHKDRDSWRNFKAIADFSEYIVLGKVTGIRQGFWISTPGTLLRIEPVHWLKSFASWTEKYLFFPVVEMEFGGKTICFQSEHYPMLPEPGWQVLISYNNALKNRDEPAFIVQSAQIIVIPPEGPASLPKHLREREPDWVGRGGAALLSDIQARLDEEEAQ